MRLSVIIPAYNEAGRIGPTLTRMDAYLSHLGMTYEIVVVDDGSTDTTCEIVLEMAGAIPAMRLIENGVNRGKGFSVKTGFLNSSGEFVLFSDADLSTPIGELERFLPEMDNGADIVIGSRAVRGADIVRRQPLHRMLMGKTFNKIVRLFTMHGISDTQCGFKLFRRSTCEVLFRLQRVERFAFDAELLFLAKKRGLKIREMPVRWINSPESKVGLVRDSSRMLADIIRVRLDYLKGRYPGL
ncbi:MAG: glycosyltransferase family 2 protein [Nitrospirae bacterium]|nr:glycosyltransferase family 2 protein [Nitrospirota bacterium]MBI5695532.1 glycosyltransferase family 2 protein [Nitrospirota bacterium]